MDVLDRLRDRLKAVTVNGSERLPASYTTTTSNGVSVQVNLADQIMGSSPTALWRSQPYLRAVVDFLARNIAQLKILTYLRVSDLDRERDTIGTAPLLLGHPNKTMTQYELVRSLVSDLALYDRGYWFVTETVDTPSGWTIQPLPASWVTATRGGDAFSVAEYQVTPATDTTVVNQAPIWIKADKIVAFHGWDPASAVRGTSAVQTLKLILAEQTYAAGFRQQVWRRAGRAGSVVVRPAGAPRWSDAARDRFLELWRSAWTGPDGPKAGGTPLLEDGMELKKVGFSAADDQYVEGAKLALTTVCSVYHVNPTMLGLLDNANYSNVREFRRMLYGDTLGPWLAMLEDRINTFLLPMIGADPDNYVEFNIAEKLQGSFEEQASVMSTMVGRPIMTANEGRARFNLPAVDGGSADELIIPMNVTVGGQPSPQTPIPGGASATTTTASTPVVVVRHGPVKVKAKASDAHAIATERVLSRYFTRQASVVLGKLSRGKSPGWWDAERWDTELTDDLFTLSKEVAGQLGAQTAADLGYPGGYDEDRTLAFLTSVAESRAAGINKATFAALEEALSAHPAENADGEPVTPRDVYQTAQDVAVPLITTTMLTTWAGFATTEAARQTGGDTATKTWLVNSRNPRPAHAAMNGESVGIHDQFSNGADWPGDPVLGADGVAGCLCSVEVNVP